MTVILPNLSSKSSSSFVKVAKAYGIEAIQVKTLDELQSAISLVKKCKGPFLIELVMGDATDCRPRLEYGYKLDEQVPLLAKKSQC